MTLLGILGLLPTLINAVELLFMAFPGQGAVKKPLVLDAVGQLVTLATAAGVNTAGWAETASGLIDGYVAVKNALGEFEHGGKDK